MRCLDRVILLGLALVLSGGCSAAKVSIRDVASRGALDVVVDTNRRVYLPGRRLKFWVDITNKTGRPIDLDGLTVELEARPRSAPQELSAHEDWTYNWGGMPTTLAPGRKITLPIVPESQVEFRLDFLREGDYLIVAVVNGRYRADPYVLKIERPDLKAPRMSRRSLRGLSDAP